MKEERKRERVCEGERERQNWIERRDEEEREREEGKEWDLVVIIFCAIISRIFIVGR